MARETEGRCFELAAECVLRRRELAPETTALVVHGVVTQPDTGLRHVHAWVEESSSAFDPSAMLRGHLCLWSRNFYYRAGEIVEPELVRYTANEVLENVLKHETYGPWDQGLDELQTAVLEACEKEETDHGRLQ